ncbi:haloalkane dehalogenase [Streptomyces sp. 4N509B]|uniref:haloalkane dehalogenase n=1 Tax=Streptomyces sp. 4N509B TaxID=3457413 RepID=UPI003FD2DF0A
MNENPTPSTPPAKPMAVVRTPDERFGGLPDFPFAPHYVTVAAGDGAGTRLRVHHLDERPADGAAAESGAESGAETIVLLHGNPSWSYLWRHVIPPLVAAGHRCVAPDLVGFGRSDKPVARLAHSYQSHTDWLREALLDRLDLTDVTLVCHDWGGALGLRLLAEHPDRFRRVVAVNTGLDTGEKDLGPGWQHLARWFQFSQRAYPETFRPSGVVAAGSASAGVLDPAVLAAYDAPFPDEEYLAGVRQFPLIIPISPDDPASEALRGAWRVLETLTLPFLCVFGAEDSVSGGDHTALSARVPGAHGQPHAVLEGAGHFLQEDWGGELAALVADFVRSTPAGVGTA